jgi:3-hydroxyisobutyrate dehydrogenase-like beta-hydroxyacid dehydrogenase
VIVGLVHPGEMGAAVGDALAAVGHDVVWASEGRSDATRARAAALRDVVTLAELLEQSAVVLSIVPPHAALDVARATSGFAGVYVDANAVSPQHAQEMAALQPRFVDGSIIGNPPRERGTTRLYLSGGRADEVAALFAETVLEARVVPDASALKMVFAAWSKGSAALLLAIERVATRYGVWADLEAEWDPALRSRLEAARRSAAAKGWRWTGEMDEIADTFAAAGQPEGFHRAAAEVYRP